MFDELFDAMDKFSVVSKSIEDTNGIAALVAPLLELEDAIVLSGDLGAGKTYFVKAFAQALGSMDHVTSPTYGIANFYKIAKGELLHIDAYRLTGIAEFRDLGLDEYFSNSITFAEWGQKIISDFSSYLLIEIEHLGTEEDHRKISFSCEGERWADFLKEANKKLSNYQE